MHGGAAGRYSDDNVELDDELGPDDAFDEEGFDEGQVCRVFARCSAIDSQGPVVCGCGRK